MSNIFIKEHKFIILLCCFFATGISYAQAAVQEQKHDVYVSNALEQLFEEDEENRNAAPVYDFTFRYNFRRKIAGRQDQLPDFKVLKFEARPLNGTPKKLQIALIDKNGAAFGQIVEINSQNQEYSLKINEFKPVKTVTLPRPYPTFLPYYFEHENEGALELENIESLQIYIGPGLEEKEKLERHEIGITSFRLEK